MNLAAAVLILVSAILGFGMLCLFVAIARHEKDAWLGRRLVEAAGSDDLAKLAIVEARAERQLREAALNKATDDVFRRGARTAVALRLVKW